MTLDIKSAYDKEFQHKLSSIATIIIILGAGLGIGATIAISTFITTTPIPSPNIHRSLVHGSSLAAAVWASPDKVPFFALALIL